jgi:hypothetical protein
MLKEGVKDTIDDLNRLLIRQAVSEFLRACERKEKKMLPPGRIDAKDHLPWYCGGKYYSRAATTYKTKYCQTDYKSEISETGGSDEN